MKKFITGLILAVMILMVVACTAVPSGTTAGSTLAQTTSNTAAQTTSGGSTTANPTTASTPAPSAPEALAANEQTHESAGDYTYDAAAAVPVKLNGDSISAQGSGITVTGSKVTITAAGTYIISGSLSDGQIVVSSQSKETVRLVLNGVDIHSSSSAPIYIAGAKKVVIILADGTENKLSDGENYTYAVAEDEEPSAAIFSKSDLSIAGNGSLTVAANFRDGISSKDGLIIASGNITVNAADDGILGKDYLVVKDGSLTINAQGDGLKSDNEEDASKGYISIVTGTIQVTAGGDAINAQTDVIVSGGTFNITSGGGSSSRASESTSAKGIKGAAGVNIDNGTFAIDSADDTIHSNGSITINGGMVNLSSADDGMHADQTLTINGGVIQIVKSYEGLESAVITLNDGSVHLAASDDGINVAGGNDGSGTNPGFQGGRNGGPGQDAFASSGNNKLYIQGGYLYVDANGDGLDSNGTIEMTGGVVVVNGPTEQMNGPLDHAGFTMTGGFIVAVGSSGMAQAPDVNSSQPAVLVYLTSTQPEGSLVNIQDETGKTILTFASTKQYQSIVFSSPDLAQGKTYTVYTGGSAAGTAVDGLYQDGTYTPGSQVGTFTTSSMVTTLGTGGRMGPGGGRRP